jgi:hypothetical protein
MLANADYKHSQLNLSNCSLYKEPKRRIRRKSMVESQMSQTYWGL